MLISKQNYKLQLHKIQYLYFSIEWKLKFNSFDHNIIFKSIINIFRNFVLKTNTILTKKKNQVII